MDTSSQETEFIARLRKLAKMTPEQAADRWQQVKHLNGSVDDKLDATVDLLFKANGEDTETLPGEPPDKPQSRIPPEEPAGDGAAAGTQGKKTGAAANAEPEPEKDLPPGDIPPPKYDTGSKEKETRANGEHTNGERNEDEIHIELYLVEKLEPKLPPILTQGETWRVYQEGIWGLSEGCQYHREALDIIPKKLRTERLAKAVLRHIQGKHQLKKSPFCGAYKFDGKDILICVANGVLRITASGDLSLEDYSKDHYFTQKLAVPFEPKAIPNAFNKALVENLPEPKDRRLFGLFNASVFVPDCRWEAALCCYGEAGTGKSTLFEGIEAMIGKGPCQALSLTQLCDTESYNAHELEFAMLNFSTELNALELTSERFKQFISGETVPVRPIYRAPYNIKPTCKFAFLTNHLPRFKHGSGAELRRLYFLKFAHVPSQKDLELKKEIAKEGAGILNLLVRLVPDLLKLQEMPQGDIASESARERFRVGNDPVGVFVETECELRADAQESKTRMEEQFKAFLNHNGLPEQIFSQFLRTLYDRHPVTSYRPRQENGSRPYLLKGIELKPVTESQI
jgi:P4 family phage/plasmid primase-like protien